MTSRPGLLLLLAIIGAAVLALFAAASAASARDANRANLPAVAILGKCAGIDACSGIDPSQVGEGSCNGDFACRQFAPYTGTIAAGSCLGFAVCNAVAGSIGAGSCAGDYACYSAAGSIGAGSCNDDFACYFAAGSIGNNSCNTTGTACQTGGTFPVGDCQRNDSLPAGCITPYTVTFDANGGTGTMAAQTANLATALTANAFTRAGYSFTGWNTAANGTGTAYANGASYPFTADATLYAQWTVNSYTVTFDSNGGSGSMGNQSANYNVATALTSNTFTRPGYSFAGWNTAANGTGTAYANGASYPFTADATLYAQWVIEAKVFTVTAPPNATAGTAFNFTVTALDAGNNIATGYAGTVHFTSSDGAAVLPADATLVAGTGTFSATLKTAGNRTLTATDTVTAAITGSSGTIAVSAVLDIDANGSGDALTDGLLVIRYLYGLTGAALTGHVIGAGAMRADPGAVATYLSGIRAQLDVDASGASDAATDGLLILRYLFGLRGGALIAGVPLGSRNTAAAIEAYIRSLLP